MKNKLYQSPKDKDFSAPFVNGFVSTLGRVGYMNAKNYIRNDDEPENGALATVKGVLKQAATRSIPGNHSEQVFLAQDEGSSAMNNELYNSCLQQIDYKNLDSIIAQERLIDFVSTVYPTQKPESDDSEVKTQEFSESLNTLLDKDFALFKDIGVSVARGLGKWATKTSDNKTGGIAGKIASGINKINDSNKNTITSVDKFKAVTATGRQNIADKVGANINSKIDSFKDKILGNPDNDDKGGNTFGAKAKQGLNEAKENLSKASNKKDRKAAQEQVDKAQKRYDRVNTARDLVNDAKNAVNLVKDEYGSSIVKSFQKSAKAATGAVVAKKAIDSVQHSQSNNNNPYKPVKGSYA